MSENKQGFEIKPGYWLFRVDIEDEAGRIEPLYVLEKDMKCAVDTVRSHMTETDIIKRIEYITGLVYTSASTFDMLFMPD